MKRHLIIVFVVLITILAGVVALRLSLRSRAQGPGPEYVPRENRLQWWAQKARAAGKDQIEVPAPDIEYSGSSPTTNLDKALSAYSVVLAQPIQEHTFAGNDEIITWYKFKILESLVKQQFPACNGCYPVMPPAGLAVQSPDEFVAARIGGTVVIDGVNVSMTSGFPRLQIGSTYLLFISKYESGGAEIGAGPDGVFAIDVTDTDHIRPLRKSQHPLQRDIEAKQSNSLNQLRKYIQSKLMLTGK